VAEREVRRDRSRRHAPANPAVRERAADEAGPTHPILALQRTLGNRAVQRLLMQRSEAMSATEQAERYIRDQIARRDKLITRTFENLEGAFLPGERERKVPLVQHVKKIHLTTGILTLAMLEMLYRAIQPVKIPDYVDRLFALLRNDVRYKAEMIEGLEDPWEWYNKHMDKLLGVHR
jgi:hypothetical protein